MADSIDTSEATKSLLYLAAALEINHLAAMEKITGLVRDQARAKHNFRTINGLAEKSIVDSIPVQNPGEIVGQVEIDPSIAAYAVYQHEGTGLYGYKHRAFDIFPKNKKMLRFATSSGTALNRKDPYGRFREGAFTFAYGVTNPGVHADPFLYNALDVTEPEFQSIFDGFNAEAIKEAGLE